MNNRNDVTLTTENALSEWRNSKALADALAFDVTHYDWEVTEEQKAARFHFYRAVKQALKPCGVGPLFLRKRKLEDLRKLTGLDLTTEDYDTFKCEGFNYPLTFLINLDFSKDTRNGPKPTP
jgi:hypothetical protein